MKKWIPDLAGDESPLYLALTESLVADVEAGKLLPGDRLPTHRALAEDLGIAVGTVTRAYREAESRGIIESAPGRGTFVRERVPDQSILGPGLTPSNHLIDLSMGHPVYPEDPDLGSAFRALSADPGVSRLLRYQTLDSHPRYKEAGIRWLSAHGIHPDPEKMLIMPGAQFAVYAGLSAIASEGDVVLVDEVTYPGYLSAGRALGLEVRGVAMDRNGMDPDALREASRDGRASCLVINPTIQNPTSYVMPEGRRKEIAEIAAEAELGIIEDDSLRMICEDSPPPIASYQQEKSLYIASLSKSVAGGLRLAFVQCACTLNCKLHEAANAILGATVFMVSPIGVELGANWILDGTAMDVAMRKRQEAEKRQTLAQEILGPDRGRSHPQSYYYWMELPEGWTSAEFVSAAQRRGVGVTPSRPYAVAKDTAPPYVRVCLSAAENLEQLGTGLKTLAALVEDPGYSSHHLF